MTDPRHRPRRVRPRRRSARRSDALVQAEVRRLAPLCSPERTASTQPTRRSPTFAGSANSTSTSATTPSTRCWSTPDARSGSTAAARCSTSARSAPSGVDLLIERVLAPLGRRVDRTSPIVDARLADGARVCAVLPPIAVDGPDAVDPPLPTRRPPARRLHRRRRQRAARRAAARSLQLIVSGATSSGKTSLVAALARPTSIRPNDSLVVEDTAELPLRHPHAVRLEARPPTVDGPGAVDLAHLVRTALRLRPDRIVVGEVRGDEVLALVQAMNTGHDGSISTCHANGPTDALLRLESLVLQAAPTWPLAAIRHQLARSIDVIVHVDRCDDGRSTDHRDRRGRSAVAGDRPTRPAHPTIATAGPPRRRRRPRRRGTARTATSMIDRRRRGRIVIAVVLVALAVVAAAVPLRPGRRRAAPDGACATIALGRPRHADVQAPSRDDIAAGCARRRGLVRRDRPSAPLGVDAARRRRRRSRPTPPPSGPRRPFRLAIDRGLSIGDRSSTRRRCRAPPATRTRRARHHEPDRRTVGCLDRPHGPAAAPARRRPRRTIDAGGAGTPVDACDDRRPAADARRAGRPPTTTFVRSATSPIGAACVAVGLDAQRRRLVVDAPHRRGPVVIGLARPVAPSPSLGPACAIGRRRDRIGDRPRRARAPRRPHRADAPADPGKVRTRANAASVVGAAIAAALCVAVVAGPLAIGVAPRRRVVLVRALRPIRAARRRRSAIERALPDAMDLLVLSVRAGLTPFQAVCDLATSGEPPVGDAFAEVVRRTERGQPFADALAALPEQLGSQAGGLADVIATSDRHGLPLGPVLDQLTAEVTRHPPPARPGRRPQAAGAAVVSARGVHAAVVRPPRDRPSGDRRTLVTRRNRLVTLAPRP